MSGADSRFYTGSRPAGVARQTKDFKETEPAQRRFCGRVWWHAGGAGGDGAVAGAKSRLRERMVLDVARLRRAAVEVVGKERRPGGEDVPPPAK